MITFSLLIFIKKTHIPKIILHATKNEDICDKSTVINATKQGLFILLLSL